MKPLPAKRPPITFYHYPYVRKVFWGFMIGTFGVASIGEHFGMWEWLKPVIFPYKSIKAIAAKERSEENEALRVLYPMGGQEKNVEALKIGDQHKIIGDILPVGDELIRTVQEKASNEKVVFTKSPTGPVKNEEIVSK